MILVAWIVGVWCILQTNTPTEVRVKHKEIISPSGGPSFITAIDLNTVLTVDSSRTIKLWEFKENKNLRRIATLPAEKIFGSFDWCQSSKMLAFSNSASINNEI